MIADRCKHERHRTLTTPLCLLGLATLVLFPACASIRKPSAARSETADKPAFQAAFVSSIFRILDSDQDQLGTGFAHQSGNVITAAHVVAGHESAELQLLGTSGNPVAVAQVVVDEKRDLGLLIPETPLNIPTLVLSDVTSLEVGTPVTTWGYPAGYHARLPMLTGGVFSGVDVEFTPAGDKSPRLVINAAFNSGNSGGPVINSRDGRIIGVAVSKLTPLPPSVQMALDRLESYPSCNKKAERPGHGREENMTEWQLVATVLRHLERQVQLVVGYAVPSSELRAFLTENRIEP